MSKITVENHTGMDDFCAMQHALTVVQGGRISNHGTEYCYATTFLNGVVVTSRRTKAGNDILRVTRLADAGGSVK